MTDSVIIRTTGQLGHITLNRPEALHALNMEMCSAILAQLKAWQHDPAIMAVMLDHADGSRGFCAGGDIAMLRNSGLADGSEARNFFACEYRLNALINAYTKPLLAFIDGVTMGGGVGLSVHGSHRIATERTLFAMPETGIGLFPDVGGGWFLPRLKGELGTWLALTGARLKGADVVAAGIGTHFVPSQNLPELKHELAELSNAENIEPLLARWSEPVGVPGYAAHQSVIDTCFSAASAELIVKALNDNGSEWALEQAKIISTRSPETVKVTLHQLRQGAACTSFEDNMVMEYRIGWRKISSPDFIEGVRAVIIDKDHKPVWSPNRLEDVTSDAVAMYFAPLGDDELTFE